MAGKAGLCKCGMGYDDDGDGNCPMCVKRPSNFEARVASTTLETSITNLKTAKLALKNVQGQISMRVATVAQMATAILTSEHFPNVKALTNNKLTVAQVAVTLAMEIMKETELAIEREKEAAITPDNKKA